MMSYFRHPQTRNEKRKWYRLEWERKEYGFKIKAKASRSRRNLVDSYDDINKSYGWEVKSWKHYKRSKQWDRSDINKFR